MSLAEFVQQRDEDFLMSETARRYACVLANSMTALGKSGAMQTSIFVRVGTTSVLFRDIHGSIKQATEPLSVIDLSAKLCPRRACIEFYAASNRFSLVLPI